MTSKNKDNMLGASANHRRFLLEDSATINVCKWAMQRAAREVIK